MFQRKRKDAAAAQIKARLQENRALIGSLYGVLSNASSDPLSDWVAHDPVKKAWAMNVGNRDALMQMINSGGIDAAYQDDVKTGWRPNGNENKSQLVKVVSRQISQQKIKEQN